MPIAKYTLDGTNWIALPVGSPGQPGPAGPTGPTGVPGVRNRILNGDFAVNQRGLTSITTGGYGFDRWTNFMGGGTVTYSAQPAALGELPESSKYFARVVVSGQSATSHLAGLSSPIEGVRTLAGKTATVSFWAKSSSNLKISVEFYQGFGAGGVPNAFSQPVGTITTSNAWARYSLTGVVPSVAGKTIGTSGDYMNPHFWFSAGTDYAARSSSIGIQSGTFDFWGVQVEEGSVATSFEIQSYADNLRACQRYFQRWQQPPLRGVMGSATGIGRVAMPLPVTMYKTPTLAQNGNLPLFDGVATGTLTSIGATYCSPSYIEFDGVATSFSAQARPCLVYQGGTASLDLSAEL